MSTKSDSKMAVRLTNTTQTPCLVKRNTQIAETFVVTPEQAKFIKPADMAIFSMIAEGDSDLTVYLNDLFRSNKPEQQSKIIWFPTRESPGRSADHTPIKTRILKKLYELKEKEKLNRKDDAKS